MNYPRSNSPNIKEEHIISFLNSAIEQTRPYRIITVERKGTALLRTYIESDLNSNKIKDIWSRVLSSEALRYYNKSFLQKGNVLIVDDGIYGGKRIGNALNSLVKEKKVAREHVKVAVFGVHERSSDVSVDFRWYGQLNDDKYRKVRENLIRLFQQKGCLLLDTEHIEIPVEIKCGRLEFFDALCRAGVGVEFFSSGGRLNLTIHNPILVNEQDFLDRLPDKVTIRNVIRKVRVVERSKNRYAIIPIFYPSTPSNISSDALSKIDSCLSKHSDSPESSFHLIGIYASIHLFSTVFMCLRELIRMGKVNVRIPRLGDPDDSLVHLLAIFPDLDIEELRDLIEQSVEIGRKQKAHKNELLERSCRIEAIEGTSYAERLNQLHWLILREVEQISDNLPGSNVGATLSELMNLSETENQKNQNIEKALLSTALDCAIDDADLVPDLDKLPFADGTTRYVRTFRIDGEVVLSDIRRVSAIWRSALPPPCKTR